MGSLVEALWSFFREVIVVMLVKMSDWRSALRSLRVVSLVVWEAGGVHGVSRWEKLSRSRGKG